MLTECGWTDSPLVPASVSAGIAWYLVVLTIRMATQNAAQQLAAALPPSHRVLLIEPHSHFHHLFAFASTATAKTYNKGI